MMIVVVFVGWTVGLLSTLFVVSSGNPGMLGSLLVFSTSGMIGSLATAMLFFHRERLFTAREDLNERPSIQDQDKKAAVQDLAA
jgi:uncharacterized membrane protein YeaQ/YmgE (transglycosylase-associated protein family)